MRSCWKRLLLITPAVSLALLAFLLGPGDRERHAAAESGGRSVSYASGWNIVGGPQGATFPVVLYAWDTGRQQYLTLPAGAGVEGGRGYWAYFNRPTSVTLPTVAGAPTVPAIAGGQLTLIANPFGNACAGINVGPPRPPSVSDGPSVQVVYTYDPARGAYSTGNAALLQPGRGAWIVQDVDGRVPIVDAGPTGAGGACIAPP